MTLLTKAAILAAQDIKTLDVEVEEWAGTVRLRAMSALEREQLGLLLQPNAEGKVDATGFRIKVLARCIVGDDGQRLFSDEDVAELGAKSESAIARVYVACEKINAMGSDAVASAEGN